MMTNKLSVRRARWTIRDDVHDTGLAEDRDARRLVVLIHGFNVSEEDAHWSFKDLRAGLQSAIPGGERRLGAVWEFHWPGDHPSGALSKATYPARVPVAQMAGARLAKHWLARRTESESVVVIAHSLGCRVALEAIRTISQMREQGEPYDGPHVEAVFLLAAAVPVDFCSPGIDVRFEAPLSHPTDPLRSCKEHVFHSRRDRALKRLFDMGQGAIPEPGNAVGRRGLPDGRWSSGKPTLLRHDQYWRSPKIAGRMAELLDLSRVRTIGDQPLPVEESSDDARRLPERRLGVRTLLTRVL